MESSSISPAPVTQSLADQSSRTSPPPPGDSQYSGTHDDEDDASLSEGIQPGVTLSSIIKEHQFNLDPYIDLYKYFHANPELSFQEHETAKKIISVLQDLSPDFQIYPDISTGLAAVLSNGLGSTVLLRADIDALPVKEKTGLAYASTKVMADLQGIEKPVMHACGHDMHITSLLAAAQLLLSARAAWTGTLILCFQPAEERGAGAQAMVDAGLYSKVPVPDIVLGGHVMPMRTGQLGTRRGVCASSADSFAVTLHGRASHGSQPHRSIDPIVLAAHTVLRLQTITSREIDPAELAVLTVGAIHAGDAENIIPESADLKLDIRALTPDVRARILASMRRIVEAEAAASNAPAPPTITRTRTFPFLVNDELATALLEASFSSYFNSDDNASSSSSSSSSQTTKTTTYSPSAARLGGSEDFGILATAIDRPAVFWTYGGVEEAIYDAAEAQGRLTEDIPVNHSAFFAPVVMPTLRVAVDAYAVAALTWLKK